MNEATHRSHLTTRIRSLEDGDITALQMLYACPSLPTVNSRLRRLGFLNDSGTLQSNGRAAALFTLQDCSWCGAECRAPWINRTGELFCSRSHRQESNAALNRLLRREGR